MNFNHVLIFLLIFLRLKQKNGTRLLQKALLTDYGRTSVAQTDFFPLVILDEIWDLIESVSEGFPTYSWDHKNWFQSKVVPASQDKVLYL